MKKTIVFTGGGSAGHVTPNIAIIDELDKSDWDIQYIGSKNGIEKELIEKIAIPYHGISSGKLRRYLDFENVKDSFRVLKGCLDARRVLRKLKPALVFSKGGFVSVPVIIAAKSLKIPVLIHESDMTPGLANKIAQRFATKIFTSFEETLNYFPKDKTVVIGSPIRRGILKGSPYKGIELLGFDRRRPVLTVMGGSLGAKKINETIRAALPQLKDYQIIHLCGKGNVDENYANQKDYKQFEYVHDELPHYLAATDFVITRGGSNSIFEFLALRIPMLIIPLTKNQSRGDQILNGKSFQEKGYAMMLEEEHLSVETLVKHLADLKSKRDDMKQKMTSLDRKDAISILVAEINGR
ncbi:undecaprenyldiphospho-muramoylpentapeptide beta-N-acetylglucosaminyltransferase [Metabacillus idriensis]|uniref:UDP-N-acetylglucosamine--N-acetylmuramyl-(pentapeptide) pyrophosphoryl-undecaprenol N-acetylglucosamine transferase n=1 Tax=Metabacillus idriensis TaxID=324768 RepID=A0A6I2MI08_9BACI|nr:undecaprenyldiphospho-muramoylpentapeptide beta-N-acetylglucosaminyltransferase [Metabacillus idriensis]MCM3596156.1 undecaprenyldiphospho-muramoylpentapeptide beta-N-acetylglucosaminyltransferase [Metabacillus idriensis]MRX56131.1 undecaprenyldiphospho-muramoylpentapeptide beta-N-acetylglucosaminyltransferase [Metabacillus idriensis]OHR70316.1 UDP-N-acetylglucosamine--N-acetylmuramyl-(pentapeptide) pyrophosphoryl-undecaprenol N-acetylglucosamine transferase [Bacillus sp. HMSC76G11]